MGGVLTKRCPIALAKDPTVAEVLGLFQHWEKGHLPIKGGLRDQPAGYAAFMLEVASMKAEAEAWYTSEVEAKDGRKKASTHHIGRHT